MISSCIPIPLLLGGGDEPTIPDLNPHYLPVGIHDCTLEEVSAVSGQPPQRKAMMDKLSEYTTAIRMLGVTGWILVNGSFVSSKESPGDIDIIVVMNRERWSQLLNTPNAFAALRLLNPGEARMNYRLHIFPGCADASTSDGFVNPDRHLVPYFDLFTTIRNGGARKGILRVAI